MSARFEISNWAEVKLDMGIPACNTSLSSGRHIVVCNVCTFLEYFMVNIIGLNNLNAIILFLNLYSIYMLVIGDSISRRLQASEHFTVAGRGGYSAWECLEDICLGKFDPYIETVSKVVLQLGTNDIPVTKPVNVATIILSCAQALVARNRTLSVIVYGIIPRGQYDNVYGSAIQSTNILLEKQCKVLGLRFLKIFKPFLHYNKIRHEYYERDQLHPNKKGLVSIYRSLCTVAHEQIPPHCLSIRHFKGHRDPLSNFYIYEFRVGPRLHPHVEQAYQLKKAIVCSDPLKRLALTKVQNPYQCKDIGSKIQVSPEWLSARLSHMLELLEHKAVGVEDYRNILAQNPFTVFVEDTKCQFWAKGANGKGINTLGCLHILTRCKILIGRL